MVSNVVVAKVAAERVGRDWKLRLVVDLATSLQNVESSSRMEVKQNPVTVLSILLNPNG
jgi:hypothetical protein